MQARAASMKIRQMRRDEVARLIGLWTKAGLPFRPKGRDTMRNLMRQFERDPKLFIGAFIAGEMAAAVIASDDGRKAWINRLAVLPEHRHKGLALKLIERCESVMRRRGRHVFCVLIEDYNEESMSLFERAGYVREEKIFYFTKRDSEDY
jgi:ribosomal protein S18 acetylase RimI-like enzyme